MATMENTFDESDDEFIDPRIKIELESLNQTASDVNRLEKEINEARNKYQETFYECSQELEILRKKYGGKINKARAYYETKELSKEAQSEAMLSARKFQSANGVYMAAKETISLAELRLKDDKAASLSPAWQEMLNHALIRVMESEHEKTKSEKEHLEKSAVFAEMEKKLHVLEKKHKKSISKAKSYFDSKNELELKLQQIKQSIEDLQQAMQSAKSQYSNSLKNLETISDGIHEARRQKLILMYPREPGVGAEEETGPQLNELPSLPTCKTELDLSSSVSNDDKCYSDSDEDDYDTESIDKNSLSSDIKNNNNPENNLTSNPGNVTKNTEGVRTVRIIKDKRTLRKSVSLPSYVVEEEPETCEVRRIEIETDSVLLKVETNKILETDIDVDRDTDTESEALDGRADQVLSHSSNTTTKTGRLILDPSSNTTTKTGRLILDPSALCSSPREVVPGGDS